MKTSSDKSSDKSSEKTSKPKSNDNYKTNDKDNHQGDSKQQFHTGKVNASDYDEVKRNVTLYLRDGDSAKAFLRNKVLYKKGARYYIKVDNTYYDVGYSNWGRFNRSIMYGAQSVYFDM